MLEFEGVEKCKGAPLLEGLPSQGGLTSVIAANYLADQVPTLPPSKSERERESLALICASVPPRYLARSITTPSCHRPI